MRIILMAFSIFYETDVKFFLNILTISLRVLLNKTFFFFLKCFLVWLMIDFRLKKFKSKIVLHAGLRSSAIASLTIWKYRRERTCFQPNKQFSNHDSSTNDQEQSMHKKSPKHIIFPNEDNQPIKTQYELKQAHIAIES